MELVMLAKDNGSGRDGCPSVYLDQTGAVIVQADEVDSATRANLVNLLPGETAVRISPGVLAAAVAAYQQR